MRKSLRKQYAVITLGGGETGPLFAEQLIVHDQDDIWKRLAFRTTKHSTWCRFMDIHHDWHPQFIPESYFQEIGYKVRFLSEQEVNEMFILLL
jgi:hypothetical protein